MVTQISNLPQRNQIILYRIIGNDLPPRHKEGQTLSNLRFILEHEPEFPNTRKLFVLNRIADAANEATIIHLLNEYQMEYLQIPFVEHEYQQLDFRLEDFPEPDFLHSNHYRRYSKVSKLRVLDYTYHDKNVYAMNNNGGRNTALYHARSIPGARWIMPFDGNCYLSNNGFQEIKKQLDQYGHNTKYFVIPMTRLLNNTELLNVDERPTTPEEPQIVLRFDATEEYNINMRYGRRSKLELLWRLGALENRRLKAVVPWEQLERPYSKDKGNFRIAGWVFRLFSGNQQQEENRKQASSIRAFNRLLAIQSYLDSLDESIARRTFRQEKLFLYDEDAMAHWRYQFWSEEPEATAMVLRLQRQAEKILQGACAATRPPGTHDLNGLSHHVTILTLARYFVGEDAYGQCAAGLIRRGLFEVQPQQGAIPINSPHMLDFLSDQGYAFPTLSHASTPAKMLDYNVSDLARSDLSTLLDSVRLLTRMQALTHKDYLEIQSVVATLVDYLVTSPTGIHLAQMNDHRGTYYDLQITALAAFADDVRLLLRVANRCRMRIGKQFDADGSQPRQHGIVNLATFGNVSDGNILPTAAHESLNLLYWTLLTRGIQNAGLGKDIWNYRAKNGAQISHAVMTHLKANLPNASSRMRLIPLAHMARFILTRYPNEFDEDKNWLSQHVLDFGTALDETGENSETNAPPFWALGIA
ncbi:hypothetical protein DFQ28_004376 [Apophysomyces sp. BC1034]|nr:hypothetical protein DFQ28_004376 [Apophysomyces sp. BC1034]